jgi:hypothetical protein
MVPIPTTTLSQLFSKPFQQGSATFLDKPASSPAKVSNSFNGKLNEASATARQSTSLFDLTLPSHLPSIQQRLMNSASLLSDLIVRGENSQCTKEEVYQTLFSESYLGQLVVIPTHSTKLIDICCTSHGHAVSTLLSTLHLLHTRHQSIADFEHSSRWIQSLIQHVILKISHQITWPIKSVTSIPTSSVFSEEHSVGTICSATPVPQQQYYEPDDLISSQPIPVCIIPFKEANYFTRQASISKDTIAFASHRIIQIFPISNTASKIKAVLKDDIPTQLIMSPEALVSALHRQQMIYLAIQDICSTLHCMVNNVSQGFIPLAAFIIFIYDPGGFNSIS